MSVEKNSSFGKLITRLIDKEDLSAEESYEAFCMVLNNEVTEMQQGAFLASLTSKGETAQEVSGGWKAIYELDTVKVDVLDDSEVIDNCGTGMDTLKTFNISTASSIVAAGGGAKVARHGARAITSSCGTVDMAELLGVDVECDVAVVADSIKQSSLGLFNGMSPKVHPMALGRILSQIHFGSPLNIAASLANPAMPRLAVRGVYKRELLLPVVEVMKEIGFVDALVVYGSVDGTNKGMDEASVCGVTSAAHLRNGEVTQLEFEPQEFGLDKYPATHLAPESEPEDAAVEMVKLLAGKTNGARRDVVLLNSGLIFYVNGMVKGIEEGVKMARDVIAKGEAINALRGWVSAQNTTPATGEERLNTLFEKAKL